MRITFKSLKAHDLSQYQGMIVVHEALRRRERKTII